MKPITLFDKEIVRLEKKLPDLTKSFKNYVKDIMPKYYVEAYKSIFCLECGHKFNGNGITINKCPSCGAELTKAVNYYNGFSYEYRYFEIHTTVKNFQVIRMVMVKKTSRRTKKPEYMVLEVMQHWIRNDGINNTLMKKTLAMSYYSDAWMYGTPMEPRTKSNAWQVKREISGLVYPHRKRYLPEIIRNGWKDQPLYSSNLLIFSRLLSEPKLETILKAGQIRLFDYCTTSGDLYKYWKSIKMAIRHNYLIGEASLWFDTLRMLESLNRDILNPDVILPEYLEEEHDRIMRIVQYKADKKDYLERKKNMMLDTIKYVEEKGKLLDVVIKNKDIVIQPLKSVEEFYFEGRKLKHCIYTSKYYDKPESLILKAMVNGHHTETVEISLKNFTVQQSRGYENEPTSYHDDIIRLVESNVKLIRKAM